MKNRKMSVARRIAGLRSIGAALVVLALAAIVPLDNASAQEYAVIVNPANGIGSLDKSDVVRLFLGRTNEFPDGTRALVINSGQSNPTRVGFEQTVLGKSEDQMKAYWAKQMFSGQGRPPEEMAQDADVLARVASDAAAIGYVPASMVDGTVKVVFQQ